MENRKVRSLPSWVKGLAGLMLGSLLLAGCRSTQEGYADIPELPGTPIGVSSAASPDVSTQAASPLASSPVSPDTSLSPVPAASGGSGTPVTLPARNGTSGDAASGQLIRPGETLHIVFSDTSAPLVPWDGKVKEDGTITLMFNELFHAVDRTEGDLAQEIRKRYVPAYYAQLTASVTRMELIRTIFVDGEVRSPSKQPYTGPIKVTQVIASAGGFTDFANKSKVRLIRANGKTQVINCKKAIVHPELDPEVYPGDKVLVPRSIF